MFWKDRIASPHLSVEEEIRSPGRETIEHKKSSQQITIEQNKAIPQPEGKKVGEVEPLEGVGIEREISAGSFPCL